MLNCSAERVVEQDADKDHCTDIVVVEERAKACVGLPVSDQQELIKKEQAGKQRG